MRMFSQKGIFSNHLAMYTFSGALLGGVFSHLLSKTVISQTSLNLGYVFKAIPLIFGFFGAWMGYKKNEVALLKKKLESERKIEGQLNLAKNSALHSVQIKTALLTNICHEIRMPMSGIIGMCKILQRSITDANQLERLKIIQKCSETLLDLINDVVDFSQLEADKLTIEKEAFSLQSAVQEVLDQFTPMGNEKGLKLSFEADPSTPQWIVGDLNRFKQVLSNLISNAIKFTSIGNIWVRSSAKSLRKNQFEVQLNVDDTGTGIPNDLKPKLFNVLSQVDASTTQTYGGTGLGLAICKGLCEKMGGKIWHEAKVGEGALFCFTFMAQMPCKETNAENHNSVFSVDREYASKHPLRILVAEDNHLNQIVLVRLLEKLGYFPDLAKDGHQTLELVKQKEYDLILMDCHMPEMDGFEATKTIRRNETLYRQPWIVAVTTSTMPEDINHCRQVGMDQVLEKPITVSSLIEVLSSAPTSNLTPFHLDKPTGKSDKSRIGKEQFLSRFHGFEEVAEEMVLGFFKTAPQLLDSIHVAIQTQNPKSLEIAAHTLKGAVANFYSEPARLVALKLEELGHSGELAQANVYYEKLVVEVDELKKALPELLSKRKAV